MILSETIDIIRFFLNIFRIQSNLVGNPGQFEPLGVSASGVDSIFELRVRKQDQWVTRRMTISPLGEESGSKSKCFKIIYDDLLVIKIPPVPITDFSKYIESINGEREIAQRLKPEIQCVTPTISSILRKIPPFSSEIQLDGPALEKRCLEKLNILPTFQNYLKIGGTFAFFMSLSKYSFLGSVLTDMHDIRNAYQKEIMSHAEVIGNPLSFENLYGASHLSIFFQIEDIYSLFEEQLEPLLIQYKCPKVPAYHKKEWFLRQLAEIPAEPGETTLSDDFYREINVLLNRILSEHLEAVNRYRTTVKSQIFKRTFKQNKTRMAAIIANLIRLLAFLRQKKVAMRDLKPDNVFVVADISGSPLLLSDPENFSIGLIDFETSVIFDSGSGEAPRQPMLAGTPSYATPSHLFNNDILESVYADVPRVLHLQDWQAINSMIYNVVTGQRLTQETSKLMPGIIRGIKTSIKKKLPKKDLFEKYSRVFWRNMTREFYKKIRKNQKMLQLITIPIPDNTRAMFQEEILRVKEEINKRIEKVVAAQNIFKSSKSRTGLLKINHETILRCKANWETGTDVPHMPSAIRSEVVKFLGDLAGLKWEFEELSDTYHRFHLPIPALTASDLLKTMHRIIFFNMHKPEWGEMAEEVVSISTSSEDLSDNITMTYEETIEIEKTITHIFDA